MTEAPARPKIYHIVHIDRLPSIVQSDGLLCDADMAAFAETGTMIGLSHVKQKRLTELTLESHPRLYVGQCVPFYFCPRSVMLFLIHKKNEDLAYRGGQAPIIHLKADLYDTVQWAEQHRQRWAFTLSNAGSYYFEDRADLAQLNELAWKDIQAHNWRQGKEGKQSEFLLEKYFPWSLVEQIGVYDKARYNLAVKAVSSHTHQPTISIEKRWYY